MGLHHRPQRHHQAALSSPGTFTCVTNAPELIYFILTYEVTLHRRLDLNR